MTRKSTELNFLSRVNDKQFPLDVNDGNHLVLYRRRGKGFDERAFISPSLRTSILQEE